MSRSVNRILLLGRLGKDAECKFLQSGTAVISFSMATSHRYKDGSEWKEQTSWHNIIKYGGEKVAEHLTKGREVFVEGRLQTRSYESQGHKKYVTEVIAEDLILLGGSDKAQAATRAANQADEWEPPY